MKADQLLTLAEVARRLRLTHRTAERSVKRLVKRLGANHRLVGQVMLLTESDFAGLVELMECSNYANAARPGTLEGPSKPPAKVSSSKRLHVKLTNALRGNTRTAVKPRLSPLRLVVLQGGKVE